LSLKDRLLVWQLKRGHKQALCALYERDRDDLLRLALGLLRDKAAAEDVVQDVFVDFIRGIRDFRLTGRLKGYLLTCVANKAKNYNRSQRREQLRSRSAADRTQAREDGEDWIVKMEVSSGIARALDALPMEQRDVILLRTHGDMKFQEIAALQDVSVKTVMSRYRYGLEKLRASLNGEVLQ